MTIKHMPQPLALAEVSSDPYQVEWKLIVQSQLSLTYLQISILNNWSLLNFYFRRYIASSEISY